MTRKGAFVLGTGFGYTVASSRTFKKFNVEIGEATTEFLRALKNVAYDSWLDVKNEMARERERAEVGDADPYCRYCGAAEDPDGHGKTHANDCPLATKNTTEGETAQ